MWTARGMPEGAEGVLHLMKREKWCSEMVRQLLFACQG